MIPPLNEMIYIRFPQGGAITKTVSVGVGVPDDPSAVRRQFGTASENLPIEVKFSDGLSRTPAPTVCLYAAVYHLQFQAEVQQN